jgi:agmatinase
MTKELTAPQKVEHNTMFNVESAPDLDALKAHIAFLGMPFGSPYRRNEFTNDQSNAPAAIRKASVRTMRAGERYDFDIGGPFLLGRDDIRLVDCGDVIGDLSVEEHYRRAESATRKILAAGAVPIVLGGDHGITTPILRAFDREPQPITLIHVDQHLDWREEVNGVREGYSSPIRRASEMAHVRDIFQIGLRAQGSARLEEFEAATAYGANLISAYEVHEAGIDAVLARIPDGGHYYITIDADGLDPSEMPAVNAPAPGGLTFVQVRRLIHGLVGKGRVVGMDIVEIQPSRDVNEISSIIAGRLALNFIGAGIRAGYFG